MLLGKFHVIVEKREKLGRLNFRKDFWDREKSGQ